MSIDEGLLAATNASHVSNENTTSKAWYMRLISPLWLCLLIALALRLWLIFHTNGMIDGDEALVGIQAERILQGNFPVYFYGIPYFGSLEAYLAAPFVALLGPSTYALRLEATLVSLVLVWLTYRLASFLADAAHLPTYAHRCFTLVAGLVAAIPPLYDGIIELRTWRLYRNLCADVVSAALRVSPDETMARGSQHTRTVLALGRHRLRHRRRHVGLSLDYRRDCRCRALDCA